MSSPETILLLAPPADRLVIRDSFCSKVSQADYLNHPIDLLMLSGRLDGPYRVVLLDAVVEGLRPDATLERIRRLAPRHVLTLVGAASWDQDRAFLQRIRPLVPGRIVGLGDVLLGDTEAALEQAPAIDAALLDFTGPDLLRFLEDELESVRNMVWRTPGGGYQRAPHWIPPDRRFSVPRPRHELFLPLPYRYPFVRRLPFATVLTEYGCPYGCTFCVMATLGARRRRVNEVMEELRFLRDRGVKELFFIDQCFGSPVSAADELAEAMAGWKLGWLSFSRVDLVDRRRLSHWRRAGCHTLIFGVETADRALLARYRKGYDPEQVRHVFRTCRELGIRTVATFVIGLPGDSISGVERTIRFARSLDPDFASLNVAVPRMGTPLREEAISAGLVGGELRRMDQSGTEVAMELPGLSRQEVHRLRRQFALTLYARPGYLLRRLAALRSLDELKLQIRNAMGLARGLR